MRVLSSRRGRGSCLSPPKICDHAPSAGSGDGPKDRRPKARADGTEADQRKAPRLSGASHPPICTRGTPANAVVRGLVPGSPAGRPSTDEVCEHEDDHGVKHGGAWALLWAASSQVGPDACGSRRRPRPPPRLSAGCQRLQAQPDPAASTATSTARAPRARPCARPAR